MLPIPLLGSVAYFPTGPFRMAALLRRRVVFMVGLYLGGNRYQINFEPLADFSKTPAGQRGAEVEAAVVRYAALLDQYCRQAPYNWFNFFVFWQPPAAISDAKTK
jgi:predicted LPLAT superfamily acyltransferase